ncbi:cytochrome d ubiquinol oxidase subunit II [Actinospica sp.]|uniref:cytochrome d ubiquinol oxidase subunit II n=1 Tax=Actinospica sp. TaxID=1872142 RepID=UPI002C0D4C58|nr:cytochrome d ubiquinol oxidase subunit II [Actinospica sp.]HWG24429.1 cytochrome d ubiquinol oxidase subunit II [Actinospica sp.]
MAVLAIALAGLVLYTLLAGADFGAGFWQLAAGRGERGRDIRDHAHRSIAPVWEANHVWLVLVLTVLWTGYPTFFGSVFSTLAVPLFLALLGIIFRGLSYALHTATDDPRQLRVIDTTFSISSIVTPFMLGTCIGAIASRRVPVGNAAGKLFSSWTNSTSLLSGFMAVSTGAFLAAVFLAADARRAPVVGLDRAFRIRAFAAAVVTGALAVAALGVAHSDAPELFHGLTRGLGLAAVIVSAVAALASIGLVAIRRYGVARIVAAIAVAALLCGWAAALRPYLLPGLTVRDAAADSGTLIAVIVATAIGAVVLFPSLAYLFRLSLAGRLTPDQRGPAVERPAREDARRPAWAGRAGLACWIIGFVLLVFTDADAGHVIGVIAFAAAALLGLTALGPDQLAAQEPHVFVVPPPEGPRL